MTTKMGLSAIRRLAPMVTRAGCTAAPRRTLSNRVNVGSAWVRLAPNSPAAAPSANVSRRPVSSSSTAAKDIASPSSPASSHSHASNSKASASSRDHDSRSIVDVEQEQEQEQEREPTDHDRFSEAASEELLNTSSSTSTSTRQALGRIQRRLQITFTCAVPDCGHRSSHEFSRHAYEHGIVLVQCPQCESRHLIADHLGWFDSDDLTQGGKYRTVEALLAAKGESVAKAIMHPDGTIEIDTPDEDGEAGQERPA